MESASFCVAITGASSGIGRELALHFAKEATLLHIAGRNTTQLEQTQKDIQAINPNAQVRLHSFDVSDEVSSKQWCEAIFATRLDVLIMNAGIAMGEKENIQRHFEICHTNAMGVMYNTFYALEFFNKQEKVDGFKGHLVFISSIAALLALPNAPSYSASKQFVKALAESLSVSQKEVRITTICPGFIKTPLTDHLHPAIPQMSVKKAGAKIYRAIRKGKKCYAFPCFLAFGARFYNILPIWCKRALVRIFEIMGKL
ncbi:MULTISPECIES: SDR family NAD(P)-dependent oxidoreductase [Helicobacter]|uniref:Oxidoreductase, short-chain dehydrogenase/reductase family n=1 Tax=Helicobacter typhlonius TaxID=76936 RepID=A0A099UH11_9HELI|nr:MULTISPECIES: SDR family NAD(P)-dependent oxidoreductase [Helicobacter]TLD78960.1 SDR family NAD(P)-dependent oxidoreductase [Helicobacter typhlonius]TLD90293.1 SDR family NAD(P)-dependent oxidoreductase [Helicobacter sp. MIT 03-1616]CUU40985.1 Oxidoreductase, short-chain dehydrogenase/reductase family [Helicobacter typhlonius]